MKNIQVFDLQCNSIKPPVPAIPAIEQTANEAGIRLPPVNIVSRSVEKCRRPSRSVNLQWRNALIQNQRVSPGALSART
jgi:hypothetical protein